MKSIRLIGLVGLIGFSLLGCDEDHKLRTADLRVRLADEAKAEVQMKLLDSQAEARKHRVRISELELEIAKLEGVISRMRLEAKR